MVVAGGAAVRLGDGALEQVGAPVGRQEGVEDGSFELVGREPVGRAGTGAVALAGVAGVVAVALAGLAVGGVADVPLAAAGAADRAAQGGTGAAPVGSADALSRAVCPSLPVHPGRRTRLEGSSKELFRIGRHVVIVKARC